MKILVSGSPLFTHYMTIAQVLCEVLDIPDNEITFLASGGKNGVESAAKIFAHYNVIPYKEITNQSDLLNELDEAIFFLDYTPDKTSLLIHLLTSKKGIKPYIHQVPEIKPKWYANIKYRK